MNTEQLAKLKRIADNLDTFDRLTLHRFIDGVEAENRAKHDNFKEWLYAESGQMVLTPNAEEVAGAAWDYKDVEAYRWKALLVNCYFSWVRGTNQFDAMSAARVALELPEQK